MKPYSSISIIYNPHSTGKSHTLATELKEKLKSSLPDQEITLVKTEYAGHAEELAYKIALKSERPLILSSSGDGGYHEVMNGLMKAISEGAYPVAGLLPAGNANDHYNNYHDMDTAEAIVKQNERPTNLLKFQGIINGKKYLGYAHSYIGIGLTPKAGAELNKVHLNPVKELWLVLKVLFLLKPVTIDISNERVKYYSLVFSIVKKMSKVVNLAKDLEADDGKFEIVPIYYKSRAKFLWHIIKLTVLGRPSLNRAKDFSFKTTSQLLVQLDGEISKIDKDTEVTVTYAKNLLTSII